MGGSRTKRWSWDSWVPAPCRHTNECAAGPRREPLLCSFGWSYDASSAATTAPDGDTCRAWVPDAYVWSAFPRRAKD